MNCRFKSLALCLGALLAGLASCTHYDMETEELIIGGGASGDVAALLSAAGASGVDLSAEGAPDKEITRGESAVIVARELDPFNKFAVDLKGNYTDKE